MNVLSQEMTLSTLVNAVELTSAIMQTIVGNDLADTLNDAVLTKDALGNLVVSEFNKMLASVINSRT